MNTPLDSPDAASGLASRAVGPWRLWRHGSRRDRWLVLGGWGLSVLASLALGLATVVFEWSGLPIRFGGTQIYITLYPPLLICLWWALCFGWWWGAIPAYLATFTLALYAHMPLGWALLFACANPLGFAVPVLGYRAAVHFERDLRSLQSLLFFVQLVFVGSVFGSAGALVWSYTSRLDSQALLPIWQGWWVGSFVQGVLLVGPLMALTWPALARWRERHPDVLSENAGDVRQRVLLLIATSVMGVLIYGLLTIWLATGRLDQAREAAQPAAIDEAASTLASTSWVFYWVFALIVLFLGFFIYQLFQRWFQSSQALVHHLAHLASTDTLTGLANRRAVLQRLTEQRQRQQRFGEGMGLIMLDIDHFKRVNDQHGHDAGDAVLRMVALRLSEGRRGLDLVGRWGGEEFVLVLPGVDAGGLGEIAERLRQQVAQTPLFHGEHRLFVTVSLGLAVLRPTDAAVDEVLKRADQALYLAKAAGRNRAECLA